MNSKVKFRLNKRLLTIVEKQAADCFNLPVKWIRSTVIAQLEKTDITSYEPDAMAEMLFLNKGRGQDASKSFSITLTQEQASQFESFRTLNNFTNGDAVTSLIIDEINA